MNIQVFLICLLKKPFNEQTLNTSNSISEFFMSLIGIILIWLCFKTSLEDQAILSSLLIVFINCIVAVHVLASFYILGKGVKQKCRKKNHYKVGIDERKHEIKINQASDNEQDVSRVPNVSFLTFNGPSENYEFSSSGSMSLNK